MNRNVVVGAVAAALALVAGVYIGGGGLQEAPAVAGAVAPEAISRFFAARLNDTQGRPQAIAQWQGQVLVVNFWATWCPPCREEMPALARLQTKYAAKNVRFVGISLDTADNVVKYETQNPVGYPLLIASEEGPELTRQLGNSRLALPYTVVLGRGGDVQMTTLGRVSEAELDALLLKLSPP